MCKHECKDLLQNYKVHMFLHNAGHSLVIVVYVYSKTYLQLIKLPKASEWSSTPWKTLSFPGW